MRQCMLEVAATAPMCLEDVDAVVASEADEYGHRDGLDHPKIESALCQVAEEANQHHQHTENGYRRQLQAAGEEQQQRALNPHTVETLYQSEKLFIQEWEHFSYVTADESIKQGELLMMEHALAGSDLE